MPEIKVEFNEPKIERRTEQELRTIRGIIRTESVADATVAPTYTPKSLYEQFLIRYDSTPRTRLWIYDFFNNAWKNATLS